jgi:hypothetical protein
MDTVAFLVAAVLVVAIAFLLFFLVSFFPFLPTP